MTVSVCTVYGHPWDFGVSAVLCLFVDSVLLCYLGKHETGEPNDVEFLRCSHGKAPEATSNRYTRLTIETSDDEEGCKNRSASPLPDRASNLSSQSENESSSNASDSESTSSSPPNTTKVAFVILLAEFIFPMIFGMTYHYKMWMSFPMTSMDSVNINWNLKLIREWNPHGMADSGNGMYPQSVADILGFAD